MAPLEAVSFRVSSVPIALIVAPAETSTASDPDSISIVPLAPALRVIESSSGAWTVRAIGLVEVTPGGVTSTTSWSSWTSVVISVSRFSWAASVTDVSPLPTMTLMPAPTLTWWNGVVVRSCETTSPVPWTGAAWEESGGRPQAARPIASARPATAGMAGTNVARRGARAGMRRLRAVERTASMPPVPAIPEGRTGRFVRTGGPDAGAQRLRGQRRSGRGCPCVSISRPRRIAREGQPGRPSVRSAKDSRPASASGMSVRPNPMRKWLPG